MDYSRKFNDNTEDFQDAQRAQYAYNLVVCIGFNINCMDTEKEANMADFGDDNYGVRSLENPLSMYIAICCI